MPYNSVTKQIFPHFYLKKLMLLKCLIKGKQTEIEVLEANLVSLVPEYRSQKQHLLEMASTIQKLCKNVIQASGEEKAMLLRPYLKDVVLYPLGRRKPLQRSCKVAVLRNLGYD